MGRNGNLLANGYRFVRLFTEQNMKFDALAPDLSKENSYFPRGRTLRGRMAMAKSGFVQIVGWGHRGGELKVASK